MQQDFDREVLSRLPLAEAVLVLWQFVCDDQDLDDLYEHHRGRPSTGRTVRAAPASRNGAGWAVRGTRDVVTCGG
jgi:hypothetical protein